MPLPLPGGPRRTSLFSVKKEKKEEEEEVRRTVEENRDVGESKEDVDWNRCIYLYLA